MTTAIEINRIHIPPGQSIIFSDVTWQEFEQILIDLEEHPGYRIAFFEGLLEIMVPLPEHEYFKTTIGGLIEDLLEELGIEYENFGSTTWKRQEKMAGAEPDECFYIQNFAAIRGKLEINLNFDPPPDLVIEIDHRNKSIDKLPIYARIGVSEVWRYIRGELKIYHLVDGSYQEFANSLAFGTFPIKNIPDFLRQNPVNGRVALRQSFRAWVRQEAQLKSGD